MGIIHLNHIRPGMVVASDVKNLDSMVLFPSGYTLTEKHLLLLRAWGVTEVDVKGVGDQKLHEKVLEKLDPKILAHAEIQANDLFHHAGLKHSMLKELYSLCTTRKAQRIKASSITTS